MRRRLLSLVGSLILAVLGACAGLEEPTPDPDPKPQTKLITMGFLDSFSESVGSINAGWAWELTVDPNPIVSEGFFVADLSGKAIFDERLLHEAQILIPGGFEEMMLVDLKATVHVREGTIAADDLVLIPEDIPDRCAVDKTACDPDNDLLPGTPGLQGNTDCEPVNDLNPCGRLIEIPTNHDCSPDGVCADLGHRGEGSQCATNGFCVVGPVEVLLIGPPQGASYRADASGSVHFGFDDRESTTGFGILEGGCNDGTQYRDPPKFEEPTGPNGARVILGGFPVAVEFVMGVQSRSEDGVDSCDGLSSPTPDTGLIKFPIQPVQTQ